MQLNFDARTVDPNVTFDPVPPGWYVVQIIGSEGKPTKAGDGGYLELKLQILEGEHKNRVVFDRLNLQNKNAQTAEIATKQLSAICHAVGVIQMSDTQQLHGKPLLAKIAVRPATGEYSASNDVKGYKGLEAGAGSAAPGVGGNTQGVPSWAGGGKEAAPAAQTAPAQTEAAPAPAAGGFTFGGLKGGASAAPGGPAAETPTPKWAQPAG